MVLNKKIVLKTFYNYNTIIQHSQERENMVLTQNKIIEFQKQKHHLSLTK